MEEEAVIERIASRYPSRWTRGYVRGKMRMDPAYATTMKRLHGSQMPLLDIGCGIGLLAFYLREKGFAQPITGLDFDSVKIQSAQEIGNAHYANLDFRVGDAFGIPDFGGNIVILDVLQYLAEDKQISFLNRVARMLPPGGQCILRATPRDESWRFRLTQWEDCIVHQIRWMKSSPVHYLTASEILRPFQEAGCEVEMKPLWGKTPFNSHLFVFQRHGSVATTWGG